MPTFHQAIADFDLAELAVQAGKVAIEWNPLNESRWQPAVGPLPISGVTFQFDVTTPAIRNSDGPGIE